MKDLEHEIKRVLDNSADELDAATLSRLNQARQRALAEQDRRTNRLTGWLPAGNVARYSFASVAAVAVLSAVLLSQTGRNLPTPGNVTDLEIMASREKLEMVEQLEFYQWLAEEGINHAG